MKEESAMWLDQADMEAVEEELRQRPKPPRPGRPQLDGQLSFFLTFASVEDGMALLEEWARAKRAKQAERVLLKAWAKHGTR